MILVCPSCDTRYFADDSAVGKEGRRVRCASCGHSWFAKAPEEGGDTAVVEDTGLTREQVERLRQTAAVNSASRTGPHSEYRAREHARRKRNRTMATGLGWAAGFLIFAGVASAGVAFRNQVAEAWPRAAAVYRMVGLDVNRFGLEFVNVGAKRSFDGTTPVLTVTGMAVNKGKTRRASPQVRVSLKDEAGKEVHSWTDNLSVPSIGPGEQVPFTSRIVAPPLETFGLAVTFANEPGKAPEAAAAAVGHEQIGESEPAPHAAPAGPAPEKPVDAPWGAGDGDQEAPHDPRVAPPPAPGPMPSTPVVKGADHH